MRLPLYIEFSGKRVLVIGGGSVGTRRAKKFLEAGARVRVLSLKFSEELKKLGSEGKVQLIHKMVDLENVREHLKWAHLVVLATNDLELNKRVSREARKVGVLVNNATDAEDTEVVVPFEVRVDSIRVAVTTEGKAGVAARLASEKIEKLLREDVEIIGTLKLFTEIKKYMKKHIPNPKDRIPLYFKLFKDKNITRLIREKKLEDAYEKAVEIIESTVKT